MQIILPAAHIQHDPPFEILNGQTVPYFESPQRVSIITAALAAASFARPQPPHNFGLAPIGAVHDAAYLLYLERAYQRWLAYGLPEHGVMPSALPLRGLPGPAQNPIAEAGQYCFDLSAPIVAGTFAAALASAEAALTGAALLLEGEHAAYALCRPPGHHAARDFCGGYCYLNNAAVAAHYLACNGDSGRSAASADWAMRPVQVALLDIDYHHGNGSQAIFYERSDVLFLSIHADPAREYPYYLGYASERGSGNGTGYNLNYPLEAHVGDERYLVVLDEALAAITAYGPRYLVLSAGFDTFGGDPLGDFRLSTAGYTAIGARIAALGLPTLIVQEGGYAIDALGQNVVALLRGLQEA
jgi:acetoin utilization deacetylase AcuC-like enzyme